MHTKFGARDHQRITHIVTGITHVNQPTAFQVAEMFTDRQHICQHLCRMIFVCQTVPYRNSCVFCKLFYDILAKTSVLDSLVHSSKNSCCISDALFLSDLGTCRIQICTAHSKVMSSYFKCTTCSGTCFFKNQGNVFAFVIFMKFSGFFLCF